MARGCGHVALAVFLVSLSCDASLKEHHVHQHQDRHGYGTHHRRLEEGNETGNGTSPGPSDPCRQEFIDMQEKWQFSMSALLGSGAFGETLALAKKRIVKDALSRQHSAEGESTYLSVGMFHKLAIAVFLLGLALNTYGVMHIVLTYIARHAVENDFSEAAIFVATICIIFVMFAVFFSRRQSLSVSRAVVAELDHLEQLDYTPMTETAESLKQFAYSASFIALCIAIVIIVRKETHIDTGTYSKTQVLNLTVVLGCLTSVLRFLAALWSESLDNLYVKWTFVPIINTLGEQVVVTAVRSEVSSWCNDTTSEATSTRTAIGCSTASHDEKEVHLSNLNNLSDLIAKAYTCQVGALVKPVSSGAGILSDVSSVLGVLTMLLHFDEAPKEDDKDAS